MSLPVVIRPARPGDVPLILSSWLRSYHDAEGVRQIPNEVYFADTGHHGIVTRLLAESYVNVACAADDDDAVQGWISAAECVLHYLYVKATFRRLGIAKLLLDSVEGLTFTRIKCTHWTRALKAWRDKGHPYVYDPYALRGALT